MSVLSSVLGPSLHRTVLVLSLWFPTDQAAPSSPSLQHVGCSPPAGLKPCAQDSTPPRCCTPQLEPAGDRANAGPTAGIRQLGPYRWDPALGSLPQGSPECWGARTPPCSAQVILMPWLPKWVCHHLVCSNYRFSLWFFFFFLFSLAGCHSNCAVARPRCCHRVLNLKRLSLFLRSGASSLLPPSTMATWWWHPCLGGGVPASAMAPRIRFPCVRRSEGCCGWAPAVIPCAHPCLSHSRVEQCAVGGGVGLCCAACARLGRNWTTPRLFCDSCVPECHPWDVES